MKVDRYVEPAEFERWKQVAEDMGFLYVASGPLVRSSYKVGFISFSYRFQPTEAICHARLESTSSRMSSEAKVLKRRRRSCSCRTVFWPRLHLPLDGSQCLDCLCLDAIVHATVFYRSNHGNTTLYIAPQECSLARFADSGSSPLSIVFQQGSSVIRYQRDHSRCSRYRVSEREEWCDDQRSLWTKPNGKWFAYTRKPCLIPMY